MKTHYLKSKGVKMRETFDDFFLNHPELKINRDKDGDIINISPALPDVEISSQTIINNQPIQLIYTYKGKEIVFKANN